MFPTGRWVSYPLSHLGSLWYKSNCDSQLKTKSQVLLIGLYAAYCIEHSLLHNTTQQITNNVKIYFLRSGIRDRRSLMLLLRVPTRLQSSHWLGRVIWRPEDPPPSSLMWLMAGVRSVLLAGCLFLVTLSSNHGSWLLRVSDGESKGPRWSCFYNLISGVACHHFCIPWVTIRPTLDTCGGSQECEHSWGGGHKGRLVIKHGCSKQKDKVNWS